MFSSKIIHTHVTGHNFQAFESNKPTHILDHSDFKIRTVYNIISRAEKEGRLDLNGSKDRPKKVMQRL